MKNNNKKYLIIILFLISNKLSIIFVHATPSWIDIPRSEVSEKKDLSINFDILMKANVTKPGIATSDFNPSTNSYSWYPGFTTDNLEFTVVENVNHHNRLNKIKVEFRSYPSASYIAGYPSRRISINPTGFTHKAFISAYDFPASRKIILRVLLEDALGKIHKRDITVENNVNLVGVLNAYPVEFVTWQTNAGRNNLWAALRKCDLHLHTYDSVFPETLYGRDVIKVYLEKTSVTGATNPSQNGYPQPKEQFPDRIPLLHWAHIEKKQSNPDCWYRNWSKHIYEINFRTVGSAEGFLPQHITNGEVTLDMSAKAGWRGARITYNTRDGFVSRHGRTSHYH